MLLIGAVSLPFASFHGSHAAALFRGLKVVNRADALNDFSRRADLGNDFIYGLIRHRRFIQCILHDAGRPDSLHLSGILIHRELGKGLLAAHDAAGTVGSRAVPFLVAAADTDQAAVAHVDRDQQLLSGFGGNRTLTKDHLLRVDVVVDGRSSDDGQYSLVAYLDSSYFRCEQEILSVKRMFYVK